MRKTIGAVMVVAAMLAGPASAEGVIMQAPATGPVPPPGQGRAAADGWMFYRANGCISWYDDALKMDRIDLYTKEGRVFGSVGPTRGAAFAVACATDAHIAFYMTPGNNSWTNFAVFPASARPQ